MLNVPAFFFSSRRRHTRFDCDWSSDVCSSDLYFFWSQYLVIWYGNVPIETRFVVKRFFEQPWRSEEHTSELQSQSNLVCRLLLEKKKIRTCSREYRTVTEQSPGCALAALSTVS